MSNKYSKILLVALALSCCFHLFFWTVLYWTQKIQLLDPHSREKEQIEFIVLPPTNPDSTEEEIEKEAQLVEQSPSINKKKPKEAKYLSAEDQKVKKETRAQNTGRFQNDSGVAPPSTQSFSPSTLPQPRPSPQKPTSPPAKTLTQKPLDQGTLKMLKDFIPKTDFTPSQQNLNANKKPDHPTIYPGSNNGRGPNASSDYLKDVEKGAQTLLNSHEFIYYSYYQRIRTKIQNFWEPSIKKKVFHILSQGRTIASSQNRTTKTIIVLNSLGELLTVRVISESGIRDLDEVAVEAFRAAEPFPNPPKGMADANGQIKIRWDFVLEI